LNARNSLVNLSCRAMCFAFSAASHSCLLLKSAFRLAISARSAS
jgi:hypothetical protein